MVTVRLRPNCVKLASNMGLFRKLINTSLAGMVIKRQTLQVKIYSRNHAKEPVSDVAY